MPNIPEGAKKPTDRLAKEVAADDHGASIMWRKKKVTVKPRRDWAWSSASDLQRGMFPEWAEGALTAESYAHVVAQRPSMGDFDELLGRLMEAIGQDLGESESSSDS